MVYLKPLDIVKKIRATLRKLSAPPGVPSGLRACWNGGHPGLAVRILLNYTRIENTHKVRRKTFVFYYMAGICTTAGGQNTYRFV